jgi:hypothetical protein
MEPFSGIMTFGTTFATPNAAGTGAIITQYCRQKYGITPSGPLIYALIIGSADAVNDRFPEPGVTCGFGAVNLGAHLPLEDSLFKIAFVERIRITDRQHLTAHMSVTGGDTELRVTIAFLDGVSGTDGIVALFGELALILVSPSGDVVRGNHHPEGNEEHFSTRQRVVVAPAVETGVWTIHVIANLVPGLLDAVEFAAVARGGLATTSLDFAPTTECVGCGLNGECDSASGLCRCDAAWLGQSCQLPIQTVAVGTDVNISVPPGGNAYLAIEKPAGRAGRVEFEAEVIDPTSAWAYPVVHAFLAISSPPSAFPRDYDGGGLAQGNTSGVVEHGVEAAIDGAMFHNAQSWTAVYSLRTRFLEGPTPTPEPSSKTGLIVGVTLAAVAAIVIGVLVALWFTGRLCCNRHDRTWYEPQDKPAG